MKKLPYLILAVALLGIAVFFFDDHGSEISQAGNRTHARNQTHGSQTPLPDSTAPSSPSQRVDRLDTPSASTTSSGIPESPATASSSTSLNDLPDSEQKSLWKAFSEARREVRPLPESRAERTENLGYDFYALHPKQNMTTRFGDHGVQIVSSDRSYTDEDANHPTTAWQAQIHLLSFAGKRIPLGVQPEKSERASSRMEYRHRPGLTEWFDNGVAGMEHGYTIAARPSHLSDGEEVVLEVALEGLNSAEQKRDDGTQALVFMDGEREVLSYSKLVVVDAHGNELPATMKPTDTGFTLAYNDAKAVYPVIVDPLIVNEEAKLNRLYAEAGDHFGSSVAISGDCVVVGAYADDDGGSAYVFARSGTTWVLQAKLTADDAAADDYFGDSVAISGDSIVVGALRDDDGGENSGSAYLFIRSGTSWSQQAKLTADDAAANDLFGASVAISGDSVVVGAFQDDDGGTDSGSAYVFVRSGSSWSQQAKLTADDAVAFDYFGISVAILGDSVVVGAQQYSLFGGEPGSAYVFTRSGSTWSQQAKLTASDAASSDAFGSSVAISGDTVVVGSPLDDDGGSGSGSAYVFTRSDTTWFEQAKLTASDHNTGDSFGDSVAISGSRVVVGAQGNNDGGPSAGSAYVFTRTGTTWSEDAKLTAVDPAEFDYFGGSVAISDNSVIIGVDGDDDFGTGSGSAYVFNRSGSTWSQQAKLTASDAAANDQFGISVAISGDSVIIGANFDDDGGSNSGSAYVFSRSGSSWSQQAKLTADDAATEDFFGGSVSISGDSAIVGATGGDDGGSAYVFTRSGTSWSQQSKLTASDFGAGDYFGISVSISGDSVVVGAYGDAFGGSLSGSAYVFTRSGTIWTEQDKLNAENGSDIDAFGISVSISGHSVVVGASAGGSEPGSAYVFTLTDSLWSQQDKLNAEDGATGDFFGRSVSISGDSVVVGAAGTENGGSAYVFTRSGLMWTQQSKLTAPDAEVGDAFGWSVAISGDSVVVGAYLDDGVIIEPNGTTTFSNSGSAYVFTRRGTIWTEQDKRTVNDNVFEGTGIGAGDRFGTSVAISGDSVIVGAPQDSDGEMDSGSVYLFRFTVPSERNLLFFDHLGVDLSNGTAATAFPGQTLDTGSSFTFRLANAGELDLDIQSVALGGVDGGQFSLNVPDISSSADLATGESLNFTISFNPTGGTRLRNATVFITSNDTDTPAQSYTISGLGLSRTADADLDGMSDWAEFSLRGYGFDWNVSQPTEVADFNALVTTAGYYSAAETAGLNGSVVLVDVDTSSNTASFVIGLEESVDLDAFTPITIDPAKLSADGDGNIRYEVDAPPGKKFFRAGFKP